MKYKEFLEKISKKYSTEFNTTSRCTYFGDKGKSKDNHSECLYHSSVVGGASGGSCWGTEAETFYSGTIEKFDELENVIAEFAPDTRISDLVEIRKLVKTISWTESEYYGNYSEYTAEYISIKELYDYLKSKKIL
jgi:hypothetical protein